MTFVDMGSWNKVCPYCHKAFPTRKRRREHLQQSCYRSITALYGNQSKWRPVALGGKNLATQNTIPLEQVKHVDLKLAPSESGAEAAEERFIQKPSEAIQPQDGEQ
jgi:hypothetical protein